ncbi:MAG: hypothetical protein ACI81T_002526 [Bacteroidia bacterium]|jgi:hypothetical protein
MIALFRSKLFMSAIFLLLAIIVTEICLSTFLGLGNPPLYVHGNSYGHIYAPNQDLIRFNARTLTNSYSMRSEELSKEDDVRIIKIGDSIVNGGALIDHEELSSTLMEKKLQQIYSSRIRVLNISAGGWSPQNQYAYLQKHGIFNSKIILVEWNGEDLFSKEIFENKIEQISPNMPNEKPTFAISELLFRYVFPEIQGKAYDGKASFTKNTSKLSRNDNGILNIIDLSREKKIVLIVYIHPNKKELDAKRMDARGQDLIKLLRSENVITYNGLEIMKPSYYRDEIHINKDGHQALSDFFTPILCSKLDELDMMEN